MPIDISVDNKSFVCFKIVKEFFVVRNDKMTFDLF